jgi:hypothetical protein
LPFCSGGLSREASESDESEFADPGVGPLTDDKDKGEDGDDFTSRFRGRISCCSVRGDNRTKVFMRESVAD